MQTASASSIWAEVSRVSNGATEERLVAPLLCCVVCLAVFFALSDACWGQGGPPVITTQPQGRVVAPGSSISFTVAVSSVTFPTYQWRLNGVSIPGATGTNYTINSVQPSNSGNYSVAVANASGSVISYDAILTVTNDFSIPFDAAYVANFNENTVSVFDRATRGFLASIPVGTNPVTVVSSSDGRRVFVANQAPGTISVIDTGVGCVVATISLGAGSQPGGLAVSPDNRLLYVGNAGSNTISVIDINSSSVITNVGIGVSPGSIVYHPSRAELWVGNDNILVLSATNGSNYSQVAFLSSPGRAFGSGFAFRTNSNDVLVAESCGCCGRFHRVSGTPSGGTISLFSPQDILYDNTGAAYAVAFDPVTTIGYLGKSGHCGGTPKVYEYTNTAVGRSLILPSPPWSLAVDSIRHQVWAPMLNGVVAVADTISLTNFALLNSGTRAQGIVLAPFKGVPVFSSQPQSQTVAPGLSASFSVTVNGTPSVSYQWQFNGANIPGTNSSLILNNAQLVSAGIYSVIVSNAFGSVRSIDAVLTINTNFGILSDAAYVASYSNNTVYVIDRTSLSILGTIGVGVNPYKVVSTPNGKRVFVSNQGSTNISVIDTTAGSVIATIPVVGQPLGMAVSPDSQRLYVANFSSSNISVIDINSNLVITNVPTPGNQPVSIAYHPTRAELWIGYANVGAVLDVWSASDYSRLASLSSFNRLYGSGFAFRTASSDVLVAESCGCCGRFHRLSETNSGGPILIVQPDILYDNTGSAPALTVNPVSGLVYLGKAGHCGGTPKVYEFTNNTIGRSLVLPSVPADMTVDPGRNRLWVTLLNGSVIIADTVSLTSVGIVTAGSQPQGIALAPYPIAAPIITSQPQSQTVLAGLNATFSVVATGTSPLSYQWSVNGVPISGSTSSSLSLTNVQPANGGNYAVVVSNSFGSVTSSSATLTIGTLQLGLPAFGPNGFQFRITGPVGNYVLQASTNLIDWVTIATTNNAPNGIIDLLDTSASVFDRRFYRARSQ